MTRFYSDPSREDDKWSLPNCEVFYVEAGEWSYNDAGERGDEGEPCDAGWYYWFCFPGCMPDSDPIGPFETEEDAIEAARESEA